MYIHTHMLYPDFFLKAKNEIVLPLYMYVKNSRSQGEFKETVFFRYRFVVELIVFFRENAYENAFLVDNSI
jgi:hypothetical protein